MGFVAEGFVTGGVVSEGFVAEGFVTGEVVSEGPVVCWVCS